jgi:carboxylesterase type B
MHQITAYGGEGSIPFQKAIPQSPAFQPLVPEQSKAIFAEILGNASFVANTSITSAEELRTLPFEALYATNVIVTALSQYGSFTFGPAIDPSNGSFVPDFPFRLLAEGKHHNVSVMAGHNFNEGLLFTPPFVQSEAIYTEALGSLFPTANSSVISTITDVLYPPVFDGTYGYTNYVGRTALSLGDLIVNCNAHILASALPSGYAYRFTVPPALHAQDVAYTFFNGDTTTLDDGFPVNRNLAAAFQTYITNFAMTGKPTAEGLQPFVVYGSNATVSNIGLTNLGGHSRDPAAKPACTFWNNAPYYAPA